VPLDGLSLPSRPSGTRSGRHFSCACARFTQKPSRSHLNSYAETSAASLEQTTSSSSRLGATLLGAHVALERRYVPVSRHVPFSAQYATSLKFLCSLFGRGAAGVHEANFPWTMAGLRTAATAEDYGRRCLDGTFVLEPLTHN
jgi:hypothetical protein